jgi:RNase P protein component
MKKGRRISGRFSQFRYLPNRFGNAPENGFSFILPKKLGRVSGNKSTGVSGNKGGAVLRNKVRRRFSEAIRRNLEHMPKTCYHVVCLLSPRIANASYSEIKNDVIALMKKLP